VPAWLYEGGASNSPATKFELPEPASAVGRIQSHSASTTIAEVSVSGTSETTSTS
jgi:hypothetical protein